MKDKMLSIRETAELMAVNIETLRRWDKNGTFRASERIGKRGDRYYTREHISTYLRLNSNRAKMPKLSVNDGDTFQPSYLSKGKDKE